MKTLYFECYSGISGDMVVASMLDLGITPDVVIKELGKLGLIGYNISVETVFKSSIKALSFDVALHDHDHENKREREHGHRHRHRNFNDICFIINQSSLNQNTKKTAVRIFTVLAEAEAKVHGTDIGNVHFHEVGAVDSIIDIVAAAICIDIIKPDKIVFSELTEGIGHINTQHGTLPIPVPAVLELMTSYNIPYKIVDTPSEMITPTGAAIAAALSEDFFKFPRGRVSRYGVGAGHKEFSHANILRVYLIESLENEDNIVTIIESTIDDCSPEVLGYTMNRLFNAGALDVYFTSVQMKKNRPAVLLTVLCREELLPALSDIIFSETSTIGLRHYSTNRIAMERHTEEIKTEYGILQVKTCKCNGITKIYPEYDSAVKLARTNNVPLSYIYSAISKFI